MWDAHAKDHSLIYPLEVPFNSLLISAAMESMRTMPIMLDAELGDKDDAEWECIGTSEPSKSADWGKVIGHGLRSAQFHSTLSGELMVCLAYYKEGLQYLKRGETLPDEDGESFASSSSSKMWLAAAEDFKALLHQGVAAAGVSGAVIDVVGRWKRRRLVLSRDFVKESLELEDGRKLIYKQPEGQFSNPNPSCEIHCLNWLCQEAKEAGKTVRGRKSPALLELHCGGGNNTVAMAPYFGEVTAVEINRQLAEAAEENLSMNQIKNTSVKRAASADISAAAFAEYDVVMVDPPRVGLDADTRDLVAKFDQILYISCNPLALAHDLDCLGTGFEVVSLAIFDMFPYTSHAECAARIRRRRAEVRVAFDWAPALRRAMMLVLLAIGAFYGWWKKRTRRR
ncbi:unnamed protein product [Effrenium voratum]|nr:unnamed protein product [Effrenium voratum]